MAAAPHGSVSHARDATASGSPAGSWIFRIAVSGERRDYRVILTQEDGRLTGSLDMWRLDGRAAGTRVELSLYKQDGTHIGAFTGTIDGDALSGTFHTTFTPDGSWEAFRPPRRAPARHEFTPRVWHRYFSSAAVPVLTLAPGDIVRTDCLDAFGRNAAGESVHIGGNPLIGPFLIEGAAPGDVLAVHLRELRITSSQAACENLIVGRLLPTPASVDTHAPHRTICALDLQAAHGHVQEGDEPGFDVPLRPMLGCVGVAPTDGQRLYSHACGDFGGKLDYNRLTAGARVYLPVLHYGALLFLGNGHAAQGDGAITTEGLDVTMQVEFDVDVLHDLPIAGPIVESADELMFLGFDGTIEQAVRAAIARMHGFLTGPLGLSTRTVSLIAACSLALDVPSLVGTQASVAVRLPKRVLPVPARARLDAITQHPGVGC